MIKKKIPSPESPSPQIRNGYPQDAEKILEVQTKSWIEAYPNEELGITPEDIANYRERNRDSRLELWRKRLENNPNAERVWVAAIDDKIIGFCTAHRGIGENQIGALYILPEYLGQGVGEKLFSEALAWLGEERPISLGVAKYNNRAITFYKKHGFVPGPDIPEKDCIYLGNEKIIPEMRMIKKFE